jgi:putative SOS response-associated peptidase YedK
MCGRFSFASPAETLAEVFDLPRVPDLKPRYNIAPTQDVAIVRQGEAGAREMAMVHWGLIPFWAKDRSMGARTINARAETASSKPAFRSAMRSRRCLVPADAFYEWKKEDGGKQPYCIAFADGRAFAFAGLWEAWRGDDEVVESCTILTTAANEVVAPLHDRMPVILECAEFAPWLDLAGPDPAALLTPYAGTGLTAWPVTRWVNDPTHDDPSCREPAR